MGRKLNNKSGAALVLALMFFLLCACVGVMVVTAASANAGKAAKMREEEQAYLAVKAAANSFAELMRESTVTVGYTEEKIENHTPGGIAPDGTPIPSHDSTQWGALKSSFASDFAPNSPMEALFGDDIRNLYLHNTKLDNGAGQPVLSMVLGGSGGTPGPSTDPAVALKDTRYELELEVEGSPQVPTVLLTLEIDQGGVGTDNNLYEATITARTASGSHVVTLYSGAKLEPGSESKPPITTPVGDKGAYKRVTATVYTLKISWQDWEVKG